MIVLDLGQRLIGCTVEFELEEKNAVSSFDHSVDAPFIGADFRFDA